MNIKIDGLVFDRANYEAERRVMGVTIINARMLLDRDGHLTITLPARGSCRRERPRGRTLVNVFALRPLFL